jgi:hypothetical protein
MTGYNITTPPTNAKKRGKGKTIRLRGATPIGDLKKRKRKPTNKLYNKR